MGGSKVLLSLDTQVVITTDEQLLLHMYLYSKKKIANSQNIHFSIMQSARPYLQGLAIFLPMAFG